LSIYVTRNLNFLK